MNVVNIPEIYTTALKASIEASKAISCIYVSGFDARLKEDGSPVTEADLKSSAIISKHLSQWDIPILGEEIEQPDYLVRKNWKENWCVDPLDGTKMFLRKNGEFSVNIAHIVEGRPVFGLIAAPETQEVIFGGRAINGVYISSFETIEDTSSWKQMIPRTDLNKEFTIACSRSFHDSSFPIIDDLEAEFNTIRYLKKGSALKFFDLVKGNADIYLRFGPTMEWDIAAGQAILEAMGGEVSNLKTLEVLRYNKESLYNPAFIAKSKAYILR